MAKKRTQEELAAIKERSFKKGYRKSRFYSWAHSKNKNKGPLGYENVFNVLIEILVEYGAEKASYYDFGAFLYGIENQSKSWKNKFNFNLTDEVIITALQIAADKGLDGKNLFQYAHGVLRNQAEQINEEPIIQIVDKDSIINNVGVGSEV